MNHSTVPHIMFAGGGTDGHLFPGLAVARRLRSEIPVVRISFAGCGKAQERHAVKSAGYPYFVVPARPIPRWPWQALRFLSDNLAGYGAARWILREHAVSLVIGLGGYASASLVRAAMARRIPTVLLEQNAIPGKTNRWLASRADLVCSTFPHARSHLPIGGRLSITGNPVRPEFNRLWRRYPRSSAGPGSANEKRILVLGGSNGARTLNTYAPLALARLGAQVQAWQVIHQTGPGHLQATEAAYRKCGIDVLVVSYIDEMAAALDDTDVVLSRAGGTTIAELAMVGLPAVLVPNPQATDDHQAANAKILAAEDACRLVDERTESAPLDEALARELSFLVSDHGLRTRTAERIRTFARPDAARDVAAAVSQLLMNRTPRTLAA